MKIIMAVRASALGPMSSSTVPCAELNVAGSLWAASTSSKRLSAQKS